MSVSEIKASANAAAASDEQGSVGEKVTLTVGDRDIVFLPPTSDELVMVLVGSESFSDKERAATTINFIFNVIESEDDVRYLKRRVWDREDEFHVEDLGALLEELMEKWSARPTKSPSDFLPPQQSAGQISTAGRHKRVSTR